MLDAEGLGKTGETATCMAKADRDLVVGVCPGPDLDQWKDSINSRDEATKAAA